MSKQHALSALQDLLENHITVDPCWKSRDKILDYINELEAENADLKQFIGKQNHILDALERRGKFAELAEIRADAIEGFVADTMRDNGIMHLTPGFDEYEGALIKANNYARQIRRGGKS